MSVSKWALCETCWLQNTMNISHLEFLVVICLLVWGIKPGVNSLALAPFCMSIRLPRHFGRCLKVNSSCSSWKKRLKIDVKIFKDNNPTYDKYEIKKEKLEILVFKEIITLNPQRLLKLIILNVTHFYSLQGQKEQETFQNG